MSALAQAVTDLEAALSRIARRLTDAENLDLTTRLLALRRAAGMPARLAGPSGRRGPAALVVLPGGRDAAAQFAAATEPPRAATAEELEILADLEIASLGDGAA